MLVFSTSLTSVLALSVTITSATALGIYAYARQTAGRWPALFAACGFVLTPLRTGRDERINVRYTDRPFLSRRDL